MGKETSEKKGKHASKQSIESYSSSASTGPQLVAYKTMNVGKLFSLQYYHNDPFLLAAAGDKGMVAVWETDELVQIRERFEGRVIQKSSEYLFSQEASSASISDSAQIGLGIESNIEIAKDMNDYDDPMGEGDLNYATGENDAVKADKKKKKKKNKKNS
jgi:hypothetical protein